MEKKTTSTKVLKKIAKARVEIRESMEKNNVRPSGIGRDPDSGEEFEFFQLQDFMPIVSSVEAKLSIASFFEMDQEFAKLTVYDLESDDLLETSRRITPAYMPIPIQADQATETYYTRRLYQALYHIYKGLDLVNEGLTKKPPEKQTQKEDDNKEVKVANIDAPPFTPVTFPKKTKGFKSALAPSSSKDNKPAQDIDNIPNQLPFDLGPGENDRKEEEKPAKEDVESNKKPLAKENNEVEEKITKKEKGVIGQLPIEILELAKEVKNQPKLEQVTLEQPKAEQAKTEQAKPKKERGKMTFFEEVNLVFGRDVPRTHNFLTGLGYDDFYNIPDKDKENILKAAKEETSKQ